MPVGYELWSERLMRNYRRNFVCQIWCAKFGVPNSVVAVGHPAGGANMALTKLRRYDSALLKSGRDLSLLLQQQHSSHLPT